VHQEALSSFYPLSASSDRPSVSLNAENVLAYLNQMLGLNIDTSGLAFGEPAPGLVRTRHKDHGRHAAIALDHWASVAYAERRLRDRVFNDPEIFGEPAWDALLDIAQAEAKGERLAVTSACIGSCAPSTTALRWLKILEERGLVRREADASDARRTFVRLTEDGRKKVELYFQEVKRLRGS
jgi:hypothetical protein